MSPRTEDQLLAQARHPDTRATELRQLWADHRDRTDIAEAVAAHPNCPRNLYTHFLRYLPDVLATNPTYVAEVGLKMLETLEGLTPQNPSVEDLKSDFWHDRSHHYQYQHFMRDERPEYRAVTAQFAPEAFVEPALTDKDDSVRIALARRRAMPLAWWRQLAEDKAWQVRSIVARSKYAPREVIESLRDDPEKKVAAAAIRQVGSHEIPAAATVVAESEVMRKAHAQSSPDTATLAALAGDAKAEVRRQVAANPAVPADLLASLAADRDIRVRKAATGNPALPEALLKYLAIDPAVEVRAAIAARQNLSPGLVRLLAQDDAEEVLVKLVATVSDSGLLLEILDHVARAQGHRAGLVWGMAALNPVLAGNRDFGNALTQDDRFTSLIIGVPNCVDLPDLLAALSASIDALYFFNAAAIRDTGKLEPVLALLVQHGKASEAFTVLDHPLFSQTAPETLPLRQRILEGLLAAFPKASKATAARKLLRALKAAT